MRFFLCIFLNTRVFYIARPQYLFIELNLATLDWESLQKRSWSEFTLKLLYLLPDLKDLQFLILMFLKLRSTDNHVSTLYSFSQSLNTLWTPLKNPSRV